MLHGVLLDHGRASYMNRWVRTRKLMAEEEQGRPLGGLGVGDLLDSGASGALGLLKLAMLAVGSVIETK